MESLELHEPLGSEPVVEQLVDEIVVFPVGEPHVRGVAAQIGDLIAILVDHQSNNIKDQQIHIQHTT